jgi:hypothetical protein
MGAESITFKKKMGGDQLGNCIVVKINNGHELIYHAKTHRGGYKVDFSSAIKSVDLKELLIYKILELLGIGPETHYIDVKDFYIVTKDVGYDEPSKKQGEFFTYGQLRLRHSPEDLLADRLLVKGFTYPHRYSFTNT